jgi:hypothetical protein
MCKLLGKTKFQIHVVINPQILAGILTPNFTCTLTSQQQQQCQHPSRAAINSSNNNHQHKVKMPGGPAKTTASSSLNQQTPRKEQ